MNRESLRKNLEEAVDAYVGVLTDRWGLNPSDCWWVGGRTGLDVFCFNDISAMSLEDIVYVVDNDISLEEFDEYEQYNIDAMEFGFDAINLRSWHLGAPRVPKSSFDNLRRMKKEIADEVDRIKNDKHGKEGF